MIFRDIDLDGRRTSARVTGTVVAEVGGRLDAGAGEEVIDGHGGALLPGLHDHHIHLLAMAAAAASVALGPPAVRTRDQFEAALRNAPDGPWIRGVGYHESVVGELDRGALDALVPDRPVRVQHRSGHLWILNTEALRVTGIDAPDGRVYGNDDLVRSRVPPSSPPSLEAIGHQLASVGITGVTDMTSTSDASAIEWIGAEAAGGSLPQSVVVTGGVALASAPPLAGSMSRVTWGPVKFVLADHTLPLFDDVVSAVRVTHDASRPIAMHCVTAAALALALAAWDAAGIADGDRIEHGAVVSPAAADRIAAMGLTVVTQPGFIATRGDDYLRDIDTRDLADLYRSASLLARGIAIGGSSDAPFGDVDPWLAIAAAAGRRTPSGVILGPDQRLPVRRALDLYLTPPDRPGGAPRRVERGAAADLCLVDRPLAEVLTDPAAVQVMATVVSGRLVYRAGRRG